MHAVEMSYLKGACGVNRWDGASNVSVYEICGMRGHGSGVGCFFFHLFTATGAAQGHNKRGKIKVC